MEFDLKSTIRRGNFILSKNSMINIFMEYPNLLISFVARKHIIKKFEGILFGIYYFEELFRMHFYEIEEKMKEEVKIEFKENMIPIIIDYLNNPKSNQGFYIKQKNGELKLIWYN